jgi:hypothetical protein
VDSATYFRPYDSVAVSLQIPFCQPNDTATVFFPQIRTESDANQVAQDDVADQPERQQANEARDHDKDRVSGPKKWFHRQPKQSGDFFIPRQMSQRFTGWLKPASRAAAELPEQRSARLR